MVLRWFNVGNVGLGESLNMSCHATYSFFQRRYHFRCIGLKEEEADDISECWTIRKPSIMLTICVRLDVYICPSCATATGLRTTSEYAWSISSTSLAWVSSTRFVVVENTSLCNFRFFCHWCRLSVSNDFHSCVSVWKTRRVNCPVTSRFKGDFECSHPPELP